MPDLSLQGRVRQRCSIRRRSHACIQAAHQKRRGGRKIHTIALRCQIQIEATRRRYTPEEQERLLDLFGGPTDGVRHCAACCGRTSMWSFQDLTS